MTVRILKSISGFAMVLIVLSVIPSGAFASENTTLTNSTDPIYDPGPCPSCPEGNISEENFTEVQADMLDLISKRITELQTLYSEISKVSNASDLQKVLSSDRQANEGMVPGVRHMKPDKMQMEPDGRHGFCSILLENVTDENFTDVQDVVLDSLQNMTERVEATQTRLMKAGQSSRAEELNEKITEIKNLYAEVSETSTAAELKEVLFTHEQAKALNSIEKKTELLKARVNKSENASDEQLNSSINELTVLMEDIKGAKSFDELKEIMYSARDSAM
ncbi:hypothetical protein [Methanosarcina sp. UBA5]|uniref:hypothetical protein n=1 Tax=Methanosarcina sp. UBA5 TaxID=1915593 RepID=UPI0025EBC967|nr:hypothetical protein [Methanosarcina sp. UBA5]